jgi:hypothetical protein
MAEALRSAGPSRPSRGNRRARPWIPERGCAAPRNHDAEEKSCAAYGLRTEIATACV